MSSDRTKDDPLGLVGSTIGGKYVVERVIGEGGAAIVYKGTQQGWDVPVAIKLIVSLATANERDRPVLFEEFRREGKLISDLSTRSSAIVQPRDLGVLERPGEPPIPYLVLEWLDGKTLDEVIVGESNREVAPRDLATTLKLLDGVARALAIAHEAGVVHRDVKPENLLVLDGSGQADVAVKLLDFGIAKVMQKRLEGVHRTGTMATAFTPHYGAPEQFSRTFGETGPWTDVFAMALVVIEVMRGGRRAFKSDDFSELARESMDDRFRPTPRNLRLAVSDDVEAVFRRALAVKPDHRYRSMGDFWTALTTAAGGAAWTPPPPPSSGAVPPSISAATPMVAATTAPPRGGSRALVFGAAALGALMIAGASVVAAKKLVVPTVVSSAPVSSASTSSTRRDTAAAGANGAGAASASAAPVEVAPLCPPGEVVVPGGRFTMGAASPPAAKDDAPEHTVFVDTVCLDANEVTVARYAACVDAGACAKPAAPAGSDAAACNFGRADARDQPMNCVTHDEASKLCAHEALRLPTEAEWELAASGRGSALPWGDELGADRANLDDADAFAATAPVGSFPKGASKDGVLDLVGNVAEWTADFMGPYGDTQQVNPRGADSGATRVVRGGAFSGGRAPSRGPALGVLVVKHREGVRPDARSASIGFRCASTLKK